MSKIIMLVLVGVASLYFVNTNQNSGVEGKEANATLLNKRAIDQELKEFSKLIHRTKADTTVAEMFPTIPENRYPAIFRAYTDFISDGFDFHKYVFRSRLWRRPVWLSNSNRIYPIKSTLERLTK